MPLSGIIGHGFFGGVGGGGAAAPELVLAMAYVHQTSGTGSGTWPINSNVNPDDVFILATETADEAMPTPTTDGAATFTEVTNVQNAVGVTRLTLFESTPADGNETTLTFGDSGDHQFIWMLVFRGCTRPGGTAIHKQGSGATGATTAVTLGGFTTTEANCIVLGIFAQNNIGSGGSGQGGPGWANADLTSVTTLNMLTGGAGNGGGIAIGTGIKAVAGSVGDFTATAGTSAWAGVQVAIR